MSEERLTESERREQERDVDLDYLQSVPDIAAWAALSAASEEHAIARTEVVKVLWDHVSDRLYFCQSRRWPLHFDFAQRFIESPRRSLGDRAAFNRQHYLRPDRTMQMASLVHYRDADLWTLELGPADNLDERGLRALFDRISSQVFFGAEMRYRPRSELHRRRVQPIRAEVRALIANDLWAGVEYQPITLGVVVGRLRFVHGPVDAATVLPEQILVLDHVPLDVPLCAGIVTAELQAPLAHMAVLSHGRGTPNMSLRGVMESDLHALHDSIVRLEVGARDFSIERSSAAAMTASIEARRPAPINPPELDRSHTELGATCDLRLDDCSWAGVKAAQLGEVCGAGILTFGGFVVPVYHYLSQY